ncbi:hypothetical protein O181_053570 [Austropuccinia psidii MF-1]|uniref:Uncharacterized protein n=1 Tax=Austropuccinia psidii MF-1 TaxID=1389203 RepID=A0A9Q3E0V7_9BASI|nr:hypothetical protein [Austropuccinia psidii MF-1]
MDTSLLTWNRVISHIGLFKNISSDRDPKFTSAYEQTYISFLVQNYHSKKIIEDIIRRVCPYGLEFEDSDGFNHDLCTLIPALELASKISIHASTGNTPAMLEKEWNPKLPVDTLNKYLVHIYPTSSRFK